MKFILLLLLSVTISCSLPSRSERSRWNRYKKQYRRRYRNHTMEDCKCQVFDKVVKEIAEHNKEYDNGYATYRKGVNQFSDLTQEEFLETFTGLQMSFEPEPSDGTVAPILLQAVPLSLPIRVDWRERGAVSNIKNQFNCGACWAFSATGGMEAQHFINTGKLVSLSEQNLLDCATKNRGCNGGDMNTAFRYVKSTGGINAADGYPYNGNATACRYNSSASVLTVKGYANLEPMNEQRLKEAVAIIGPICVGVDATNWYLYKDGIYAESASSTYILNHGVLVVGYDINEFGGYWIVKNSWGTTWGIKGYMHLAMNASNMCGVATMPSYPIV